MTTKTKMQELIDILDPLLTSMPQRSGSTNEKKTTLKFYLMLLADTDPVDLKAAILRFGRCETDLDLHWCPTAPELVALAREEYYARQPRPASNVVKLDPPPTCDAERSRRLRQLQELSAELSGG